MWLGKVQHADLIGTMLPTDEKTYRKWSHSVAYFWYVSTDDAETDLLKRCLFPTTESSPIHDTINAAVLAANLFMTIRKHLI